MDTIAWVMVVIFFLAIVAYLICLEPVKCFRCKIKNARWHHGEYALCSECYGYVTLHNIAIKRSKERLRAFVDYSGWPPLTTEQFRLACGVVGAEVEIGVLRIDGDELELGSFASS